MLNQLKSEIRNYDVISFDIFDTLILRPYLQPTDMFLHIERILQLDGFAKSRQAAEKEARLSGQVDEITYDDIYQKIDSSYKEVYSFELDFEKRVCQANEEMAEIYKYAFELKKRIIFVSDMYLPQELIESILQKTGYTSYEKLFLSSSLKKRKATGELYDFVLKDLGVPPQTILHIGDNKINDYEKALEKGLNAEYYPKVIDRFFDKHYNMRSLLKAKIDRRFDQDHLSISVIIGINAILWIGSRQENYWRKIGALYAGPFLYFFTKWLYDSAREKDIKNIALAARDGYNLVKIFKLLDRKSEFNARYVYLPRYVSETANINNTDQLNFFLRELGRSFDGLQTFVVDFAQENKNIHKKWTHFIENHPDYSYEELKTFVVENQELFIETSARKRELVYDYFQNMNILDGDAMIVDSSCTHARPHKLMHQIVKEKKLNVSLYGYNYKVNLPHDYLNQVDVRPQVDRKYQTDKWDFVEFFMSSPEKPIIGITKEGDEYKPVYKTVEDNEYERIRIEASELLSDGVTKFAEKAYDIFEDYTIIKDLDTVVFFVNNLISNPSVFDIAHIKQLYHSENNDSHYSPMLLKKVRHMKHFRRIYGQRTEIKRLTPEFRHFIGGSYLSPNNDGHLQQLVLNLPYTDRMPSRYEKAILYILEHTGELTETGVTNAWNFQRASFLRFFPGEDKKLLFPFYDSKEGKFKSLSIDVQSGEKSDMPYPVFDLLPNGTAALGTDSSPDNGFFTDAAYCNIQQTSENNSLNTGTNIHNGIILFDVKDHSKKVVASFAQLLQLAGEEGSKDAEVVVKNISANPGGTRFAGLVKCLTGKSGSQSFLFTCHINGGGLYRVLDSVSDYSWKDDKTLLVCAPMDTQRNIRKLDTLWELEDSTSVKKTIDSKFFHGKGRGVFSPNRQFIVFESKTEKDFPYKKLQLYDVWKGRGVDLGFFYAYPYPKQSMLWSELNTRWSPCGEYITFNSLHEGFRGVYSIEKDEAVKEMERELETISAEEIKKIVNHDKEEQTVKSKVIKESKSKVKYYLNRFLLTPFKKSVKSWREK